MEEIIHHTVIAVPSNLKVSVDIINIFSSNYLIFQHQLKATEITCIIAILWWSELFYGAYLTLGSDKHILSHLLTANQALLYTCLLVKKCNLTVAELFLLARANFQETLTGHHLQSLVFLCREALQDDNFLNSS